MPGINIELHMVNRITIGTVGPPGQRVFLLQAADAIDTVTLKLEKEQARALSHAATDLLENLDEEYPIEEPSLDTPLTSDLMLQEPMEPLFGIGQIGLGYDQEQDLIVVVVQEIQFEDNDDPATARFWGTRPQMKILSEHAVSVVEQGRPVCPLCDSPIDPEGHFCPKSNGHEKVQWN